MKTNKISRLRVMITQPQWRVGPFFLVIALTASSGFSQGSPATCTDLKDGDFKKVPLVTQTLDEPMELSVAPDGRVFFIERVTGKLKIYDPGDGKTMTAGQISVSTSGNRNDGMLGLALDPDFGKNHWIYLYYAPSGTNAINKLSRFTINGNALDKSTEKSVLEIPTQRKHCCHSAGSVTFGPSGELFLSTGDNSAVSNYSSSEAEATSANTHDLRGKILRIKPQPDGKYTIPEGNLFPKDGSKGKPEIYAMGCRNPFRISVDAKTGWLYWGDVGPDAGGDSKDGDPRGHDEFNQAKKPGFFGWPYFVGDNKSYVKSGKKYNPDSPVNESPNNTGAKQLPPTQKPMIWYSGAGSPNHDGFKGSRTAMAGPVYHYNTAISSKTKLPPVFDKVLFIYEWSQNWIKTVQLDANGAIKEVKPFLPSLSYKRPMDMEIGPDGNMYVLEYGNTWYAANKDAGLYRIEYTGSCQSVVSLADFGVSRMVSRLSAGRVYIPDGMRGVALYDLRGKKVWEYLRSTDQGEIRANLPGNLESGVLQMQFIR